MASLVITKGAYAPFERQRSEDRNEPRAVERLRGFRSVVFAVERDRLRGVLNHFVLVDGDRDENTPQPDIVGIDSNAFDVR